MYEALRMKTVDAAYVHGLDSVLGSIAPGKLADFTVLHANPLEVPVDSLRDVMVWGTVVGGVVFPRSESRSACSVPVPPPGLWKGLIWLKLAHARRGSLAAWMWWMIAKLARVPGN